MPERARLTASLVDNLTAPATGERWVGDLVQPGLGVRLWSNEHREGGRAYGVRTTDANGRVVRRSFNQWDLMRVSWRWPLAENIPTLGELLQTAREVARDEIDRLKGRPTLQDERDDQRQRTSRSIASATVAQVSSGIIKGLHARGASEAHTDRLRKLFSQHVPDRVQSMRMSDLTLDDINATLSSRTLSRPNLRVLRPHLRQMAEAWNRLGTRTEVSGYQLRYQRFDENEEPRAWAGTKEGLSLRATLFENLESEFNWQAGMCLRFYFELLYRPLSRVMSARWSDIMDVTYRFRPSGETIRRRIWTYKERDLYAAWITKNENHLLCRIAAHRSANSAYLFPAVKSEGSIKSIRSVWTRVQKDLSLERFSPRDIRNQFRDLRWLDSDHFWDRAFIPAPGEDGPVNMATLSKSGKPERRFP